MKLTLTHLTIALFIIALRCGAGEIHDAVLKHDLPAVERLLRKDRSLLGAHTFPDYKTPLHYAVGIGDAAIVKHLIAAGADVNSRDADGVTPLLRASLIVSEDSFGAVYSQLVLRQAGTPQAFEKKMPGKLRESLIKAVAGVAAEETRTRLEIMSAILARKPELKPGANDVITPLQLAVLGGNPAATKLILDAGADTNTKDREWLTPLHFAAVRGVEREVIDLLISKGARVDAESKNGTTPLMGAARGGFRETVEALIAHGANMDVEDNQLVPVIAHAAEGGHDEIVRLLFSRGGTQLISNARRELLFQRAAAGGSMAMVELLLSNGVDVNIRDHEGFTPLLTAIEFNQKRMAEFLTGKGADRTAVTKDGRSLLNMACMAGDTAMVKELIAQGADIKAGSPEGMEPLSRAASYGRVAIVEMLIDKGADIQTSTQAGITPLTATLGGRESQTDVSTDEEINPAGEDDYTKIVEILLSHGARVDGTLKTDNHAMALAARYRGATVMRALIKAGGDPRMRLVGDGNTLLHTVAAWGRAETAEVLLDAGADVLASNNSGQTPLHVAARYNNSEVMKVLLAHRAPVSIQKPPHRATPLHNAALFNSPECVRLLLDAGADAQAQDAYGLVPLIQAASLQPAVDMLKSEKVPDLRLIARVSDIKGRLKVMQMLLERVSPDGIAAISREGEKLSMVEFAARYGSPAIIDLLKSQPQRLKMPRKP